MVIIVDHSELARGDKRVCIEVVLYLLIALAVLLTQIATFVDSDLEHLGVLCERTTSDVHVFFVFHTVAVSDVDFLVFVHYRIYVRVLAAELKLQFCFLCIELIVCYRACQNLHSRNFRAWNL